MQGQSDALTNAESIADCYEYKYLSNELVPLANPVGEDITFEGKKGYRFENGISGELWHNAHVTGSSCYGNTNLVPTFCKAYNDKTKNKIIAVHIAKGSTVIADWLPGSKGYETIIKKSNAAIKKAKETEPVNNVFFVWLQGESDAIFGNSKDDYKQKIGELCSALKNDIGIEKFGVIRVGRFTNDEKDLEIISAQDEICQENSDFLMLTTIAAELYNKSEYMNPFVGGHFSAKGLEKLGTEGGKTLGDFVKNNNK